MLYYLNFFELTREDLLSKNNPIQLYLFFAHDGSSSSAALYVLTKVYS